MDKQQNDKINLILYCDNHNKIFSVSQYVFSLTIFKFHLGTYILGRYQYISAKTSKSFFANIPVMVFLGDLKIISGYSQSRNVCLSIKKKPTLWFGYQWSYKNTIKACCLPAFLTQQASFILKIIGLKFSWLNFCGYCVYWLVTAFDGTVINSSSKYQLYQYQLYQ